MPDEQARGDVLGRVLSAMHHAQPMELPGLVSTHARALGVADVVLYLVDYEHLLLIPIPAPGSPQREPLEIDTTLPGRAFRHVEVLEGDAPDGRRLWLPLLDGSDRVGVMEVSVPGVAAVGEEMRVACQHLASLVAEMIVSKTAYGDLFASLRRRRPLSLPAEIQRSLLPPFAFIGNHVAITAALEPAYRVAGDAFDYAVNGDVVHFAVFDAMGHGLEASLMATVALGAYRNGRRGGTPLAQLFTNIDAALSEYFGSERFVTGLLAELDLVHGRLRFISAGHPAPLLLRGGKLVGPLECEPVLPLGMGDSTGEICDRGLEPGDRVLAYTDGVVEARSPEGEFFGVERLADLATREASNQPPPEMMRRLVHAILAHQRVELRDDATLVMVEWFGWFGTTAAPGGDVGAVTVVPSRAQG